MPTFLVKNTLHKPLLTLILITVLQGTSVYTDAASGYNSHASPPKGAITKDAGQEFVFNMELGVRTAKPAADNPAVGDAKACILANGHLPLTITASNPLSCFEGIDQNRVTAMTPPEEHLIVSTSGTDAFVDPQQVHKLAEGIVAVPEVSIAYFIAAGIGALTLMMRRKRRYV